MVDYSKKIGTLIPLKSLIPINYHSLEDSKFEKGIDFLNWLKVTNQNAWQILPLHETQLEKGSSRNHVPSPYKGYGIGIDPYYLNHLNNDISQNEYDLFIKNNSDWIYDYALFCALRDKFATDDWSLWPKDIRRRAPKAISYWNMNLKNEIHKQILCQILLHKSFELLREKSRENKIILIGDIPFYMSFKSPLVWAHQELFQIEKNSHMKYVSGILNTQSAHYGRQIWGHPLYDWENTKFEKIMKIWKMRLLYLSKLFDLIRVDHAKGFFNYGVIDINNEKNDIYKLGPGQKALEEIIKFSKSENLSIFVEDSGDQLAKLRESLSKLQTPGINIFRFAYDEKKDKIINKYANIKNYSENTITYSTTHDTQTLIGYLKLLSEKQKRYLAAASKIEYSEDIKNFAKNILKELISSPARIVIIPIQDLLFLEDRINIPGTEKEVGDTNWQFKLPIPIEKLPQKLFLK